MIIVCKKCKASFLVPDSLFVAGPRTVRCAKCTQVWREVPSGKHKHEESKTTRTTFTPPPPVAAPSDKPILVKKIAPQEPMEMREHFLDRIKKPIFLIGKILTGIVLFIFIFLLSAHALVIEYYPSMQRFYIAIGLATPPLEQDIQLKNITSERRYKDGAMQLIVHGDIQCSAKERQVIPPILVEALGPDGHIIESWRIEPPQATIPAGSSVPFSSSILSPEGTVTEVNLSFVNELPHDDKP